jgi:hypothetical protein
VSPMPLTSRHGPLYWEFVLMLFHPNSRAVKHHAFRFQPEPLFEAVLAGKGNFSLGSYHAMPGQSTGCSSERPGHLASAAREARRARDIAVGGHFAFRNFANRIANNFEHFLLSLIPG